MQIIPAIDLIDGQVVRLSQGEFRTKSFYGKSPESMVAHFIDCGVSWIHVVNLDAARGRESANTTVLKQLLKQAPGQIEVGGGIRSEADAEFWLEHGAGRIILGSVAGHDPAHAVSLLRSFGPDKVMAGIDLKDGYVAISGWLETLPITGLDLAVTLAQGGFKRAIVTDVATDGMFTGPNFSMMTAMAETSGLSIIASGGVASLDDVARAAELTSQGIEGVIIGKAIYERSLDVAEAVRRFGG